MAPQQPNRPAPYRQPIAPPQKPPRRKRLRREALFVLLAIVLFLWTLRGIVPSCTWHDVQDLLGVQNRERYTLLACLGIACVTVCLVARLVRNGGKRKN